MTKASVETLLDLVEIKLSCIEIFDTQDTQTVKQLERCREELSALLGRKQESETLPSEGRAAA
ncbi:MAG: hypothetical protein R3229_01765 [Alphaproteobacteria bacterium]|nr:hypothetical protein [Alphaproteobacteria bacterium]